MSDNRSAAIGPVHDLDAGSYRAVVRDGVPMIERTTSAGAVTAIHHDPRYAVGDRVSFTGIAESNGTVTRRRPSPSGVWCYLVEWDDGVGSDVELCEDELGEEQLKKTLALWLLHARDERLYPRRPRFVQRWVFRRTVVS